MSIATTDDRPNGGTHAPSTGTIDTFIAEAIRAGNIEVVQAMIAMRNAEQDRQRENEANKAYVPLRNAIPQIERRGKVNTGKGTYAFAEMEDIDETIRPFMQSHGFAFQFRTLEETDAYVLIEGRLIYQENGWVFKNQRREPINIGPGQNRAQAGGAAQTYAMRYLKIALLDLILKGEDTDGNTGARQTQERHQPIDHTKRQDTGSRYKTTDSQSSVWVTGQIAQLNKYSDPKRWQDETLKVLAQTRTVADLEEMRSYINGVVSGAPQAVRDELNTAITDARARIIASNDQPPEATLTFPKEPTVRVFHATLYDDQKHPAGEFTHAASYASALITLAGQYDMSGLEELLKRNADGMKAARAWPEAAKLLAQLDRPASWPLPADDERQPAWAPDDKPPPMKHEAVRPPMLNGKPSWSGWVAQVRDEVAMIPGFDLPDWIEPQRENIEAAEPRNATDAIGTIESAFAAAEQTPPDWLDELWIRHRLAMLAALKSNPEGRKTYEAMTFDKALLAKVETLKPSKPALYEQLKAGFKAAHLRLPAAPKAKAEAQT